MSRFDAGLGVNSDDADDLEIGCAVYSRTHTRGPNDMPRGGTVVGIQLDVDESVLAVTTMEQPRPNVIVTFDIDRSDINMETVDWHGRNADVAAGIVSRWLGSRSAPPDRHVRARWQRIAGELSVAALSGLWLPKADVRVRRYAEVQRRERSAS